MKYIFSINLIKLKKVWLILNLQLHFSWIKAYVSICELMFGLISGPRTEGRWTDERWQNHSWWTNKIFLARYIIIYIYLIYILIIFFYACGFNFLWPLEIKLWLYRDLGSSPHHQQLNELSWFHILFLCLWISIGPDRIRIWSYLPSYLFGFVGSVISFFFISV